MQSEELPHDPAQAHDQPDQPDGPGGGDGASVAGSVDGSPMTSDEEDNNEDGNATMEHADDAVAAVTTGADGDAPSQETVLSSTLRLSHAGGDSASEGGDASQDEEDDPLKYADSQYRPEGWLGGFYTANKFHPKGC